MKTNATAVTLAILMGCTSIAAVVLRPTAKAADRGKAITLETLVPKSFGDWTEVPEQAAQIVNPQAREMLDRLYSQLLTRTYVDKRGYRIMVSIAYGDDQRNDLQAHLPEGCYPAQGFKLGKVEDGTLATSYGPIKVRRLETSLGQRVEPVTYWLINGGRVIKNPFDKLAERMRLGMNGEVPDGLLFRVSSIDTDQARGFQMQQRFTADLMGAVPPVSRARLGALTTTTASAD